MGHSVNEASSAVRPCPFCSMDSSQFVLANSVVYAIRDGYPVSPGHTLIIPRRHVGSWFEATPVEQAALMAAVEEVKVELERLVQPAGYNLGINIGEAAGQTVMHLHVHLIPRYTGDMGDPAGGVRGVIPEKQKYDRRIPPVRGGIAPSPEFRGGEEDEHLLPEILAGFDRAIEADLLLAFVRRSGLQLIRAALERALERGTRVRLLARDYLGISEPAVLGALLAVAERFPNLVVRLYQTRPGESFHPKAWIFAGEGSGLAWVGSSNLSESALAGGVEWNVCVGAERPHTFARIRARFEHLFLSPQAVVLSPATLAAYVARRPELERGPARSDVPLPRPIQSEVLAKLAAARARGVRAGLVVLATGLGKTWLAAFDVLAHGARRALFVAHREEILDQAAATFLRIFPERSLGRVGAGIRQLDADLVFASVFTLGKAEVLAQLPPDHFDYIVLDEFHHATSLSYRRLQEHFRPGFLLGLTATPERADGQTVLGLVDGELIAEVGLVAGIERGELVPFHYHGVRDNLDFENIPWRSGRFDPAELERAAATEARTQQAFYTFREHAPAWPRALIFCCSQRHADHVAERFSAWGVATRAVHSGPGSDARATALEMLRDGQIQAIATVDLFNEGLDVPELNLILMLRPTESPVVFLQQLGRGLRKPPAPSQATVANQGHAKSHLVVVDFIGNHRSFLARPEMLARIFDLPLAAGESLAALRAGRLGELPAGCRVEISLEVIDLLVRMRNQGLGIDPERDLYLRLRDCMGRRPTAQEFFAAGGDLSRLAKGRGRAQFWFDLCAEMGDLEPDETLAVNDCRNWFWFLHNTPMSRSYKMVVLTVLILDNALMEGMEVGALTTRCRELLRSDPRLRNDALALEGSAPLSGLSFAKKWRKMPLEVLTSPKSLGSRAAWVHGQGPGGDQGWFVFRAAPSTPAGHSDEWFGSRLDVAPGLRGVVERLSVEIVDLRLAEYLRNQQPAMDILVAGAAPFTLRVAEDGVGLGLDRAVRPDLPEGRQEVWADGHRLELEFGPAVAFEVGASRLKVGLVRWFGPVRPGHLPRVSFSKRRDGSWELNPLVSRSAAARSRLSSGLLVPSGDLLAVAEGVSISNGADMLLDASVISPVVARTMGEDPLLYGLYVQERALELFRDGRWIEGEGVAGLWVDLGGPPSQKPPSLPTIDRLELPLDRLPETVRAIPDVVVHLFLRTLPAAAPAASALGASPLARAHVYCGRARRSSTLEESRCCFQLECPLPKELWRALKGR